LENGPECVRALDAAFAERTLDEWIDLLATFDGVWCPAKSPFEVVADPQLIANGYFPEIEAKNGERYRVVASPMQFDDRPLGDLRPEPEHGEHTEEILLELGMTWEDISNLKERHAIL
jgi:crotonobetainyl-CoA:carnitine CoA-transferase CaiB-like acyl-CoA transferase